MDRAPLASRTSSCVVDTPFDRARLEHHGEDPSFPPAEPISFSQRQTSSFRPGADPAEQGFWSTAPKSGAPEPIVSAYPSLPVPPQRKPSPARSLLAKLLFATLFGGVAVLLGYALLQKLS
jgi:hypothetical protein